MKVIVTVALMLISTNALCSNLDIPLCSNLDMYQSIKDSTSPDVVSFHKTHRLICLIHNISKPYGFPETMQAILRQETDIGRFKTTDRVEKLEWAAFGIMQIQPATARWVLISLMGAKDVPKDDATMILRLKTDPTFSINIASLYFKYLYDMYVNKGFSSGASWRYAVLAYNIGPTKLAKMDYEYDPNGYLDHIRDKLKIVRAYNDVHGFM